VELLSRLLTLTLSGSLNSTTPLSQRQKTDTEVKQNMSKQAILESVVAANIKTDVPEIWPGDTVKVHVKVREGNKERIQLFEGTCIAVKHGGIAKTITLRKITSGVGVERTFPIHSPNVARFEVTRRGKVRRAKLYYLRGKVGKEARIKERR
jgi:large subunit ribosomal protein L19